VSALEVVAAEIDRRGPIAFSRFMELALYAPGRGFFDTGGEAGRARGDFLTSPEVGPLFGAVLARALDTWWDELGRPDPYLVVDAGAGPGTLALAVRAAEPRCGHALRYVLVECSAAQRAQHGRHLSLSTPGTARSGPGPEFVSLADLPAGPLHGIIVANELFDNLPFDVLERTDDAWVSVHVGLGATPDTLAEVPVPVSRQVAALADGLVPDAVAGDRFPLQTAAAQWLRDVLARLEVGRVVMLDYAGDTPELVARGRGWLRTYRRHGHGGDPLDTPGAQDVTADVAMDQLCRVQVPVRSWTQAAFLAHHGMGELVAEGRRIWAERAHLGDLEAIRARSRIGEAEVLADPGGLGAFRVLEWEPGR
jgi:SAM-dependent MidA family methyltransferase